MNLDLFQYSNPGSRTLNEDSVGVKEESGRCIAVLCDGLGGHNCGEIASRAAVSNILEGISRINVPEPEKINSILKVVNEGLIRQQVENPAQNGMRTTVVGCVADEKKITYFNTGDSRFYFFSDGVMTAMSKDHSVSQMSVDLGEMSFDDIRFDSDRNKLLKVLGDTRTDEVGTIYPPVPAGKGDAFLLCSDGFWEYVTEDEMEIDLCKATSAKEWVEFMLVRLLLRFTGNNDNFSVIAGIIK